MTKGNDGFPPPRTALENAQLAVDRLKAKRLSLPAGDGSAAAKLQDAIAEAERKLHGLQPQPSNVVKSGVSFPGLCAGAAIDGLNENKTATELFLEWNASRRVRF